MRPYPKPCKQDRNKQGSDQKAALLERRRQEYEKAYDRDNGLCVFCYYQMGKRVRADDVHHVYGRSNKAENWRERYIVMVCTCRKCHPPPIHGGRGSSTKLIYVEIALRRANETPINKRFQHESPASY